MPNPFKTPMQMMYENAHLPHYAGGSKVDVLEQFAGRIQNAIRQYTKAAGKPPTAQEVKQLEDHIRGLTQPAPRAPMTPARAQAQEPFANKLVDPYGRPYDPMPHPQTGKLTTPERAQGYTMRDPFGTNPENMAARNTAERTNVFPQDDFMSMANTGRASSRTWNKSYTPSAEELAQRQHMAEDVGMQLDEGEDLGGLAQARVTEGDIPQMTSASAPFAERSGALEAGALNQLSGDILAGKHAKTIEAVIADFRSRGIEPDREDILNAINAQINPLRHNYTGENPIGLRPSLPSGARSTPEMESWRDAMRMSGQPETTVTTHPSDWNAAPKRDYLTDTTPETRQPFAKDWDIYDLEDKRRRRSKAGIGEIQSSPNDRPSNIGYAAGGQISPRDMQAQMMVQGYADRGQVKREDLFKTRPLSQQDIVNDAILNGRYPDAADEAAWQIYAKRNRPEDRMSAYVPSTSERIAETGTRLLEKAGIRPQIAKRAVNEIGTAIPVALGAASMVNPMVGLPLMPLYAESLGGNIAKKDYAGIVGDVANIGLGLTGLGTSSKAFSKALPKTNIYPQNMEGEIAQKYMRQNLDQPYFNWEGGMAAPSNAARQEWIGKAHDVGANAFRTNDPAYKAAVFNAHRQAGHPLITQYGAQNYDDMLKMSYENLGKETAAQARSIPNKMEFWGDADYATKDYLARAKDMGMKPAELMRQELAQGKPMQVYKDTLTEKNPGHPYLAGIDPATGATQNELFRGVHDYFGHLGTKKPNTFGPKGEENAWLTHRQMYSPLAEPAATAETRGQNSYVNYVNEINRKLRAEGKPTTEFAQNTPVLLPPEASNPEYLGGLPSYLQGIVK